MRTFGLKIGKTPLEMAIRFMKQRIYVRKTVTRALTRDAQWAEHMSLQGQLWYLLYSEILIDELQDAITVLEREQQNRSKYV